MPLKHVKTVRSKGKEYFYFDTGKKVAGKKVYAPLPHKNSTEFARTYATLLGHRNRGGSIEIMRIPKLIDLYQRSPVYRGLSDGTRRVYDIYLRRLEKLMPSAPVAEIRKAHMIRLIDGMADTPGAANLFLATCDSLFKWGVLHEYMDASPCTGIDKFKLGEHKPWPTPILNAALDADDDTVRLLARMLFYTAQRFNDVLTMPWSRVEDGWIRVKQKKTRKVYKMKLHRRLIEELERTPRCGITIITDGSGKPIHEDRARDILKDFAARYGAKCVPHGLRKNAVIALLQSGCSVAETSAISGQSFKIVEQYAKDRDQEQLSEAAILQWEQNESRPGKLGKTAS